MIPKIAHFHWDGKPMPWLRMMGLYSFIRLNPTWEVRLHRTKDHIKQRKLPCYANEADWTWMEVVYDHGGFAMATDTIFVKPIPDEWCDADFIGCTNGSDTLYHCCFGASFGSALLAEAIDRCWNMPPESVEYQSMGILLLKSIIARKGGLKSMMKRGLDFRDYPTDAISPIRFYEPHKCWEAQPLVLNEETIGVTWFGGHESSKEHEWDVDQNSQAAIVKLAMKVCHDS